MSAVLTRGTYTGSGAGQMLLTDDAWDKSAELDQVSGSHAVRAGICKPTPHLDAQPEPDPVSDVESVQNMAPEVGQSAVVFDMTRAAALKTRCSLSDTQNATQLSDVINLSCPLGSASIASVTVTSANWFLCQRKQNLLTEALSLDIGLQFLLYYI